MASVKPPRRPSFDAKSFSQRLWERVLSAAGGHYAVFDPVDDDGDLIGFPRYVRWTDTLRDGVNANAIFLDDVDKQLHSHIEADNTRHAALAARVKALEDGTPPFPG